MCNVYPPLSVRVSQSFAEGERKDRASSFASSFATLGTWNDEATYVMHVHLSARRKRERWNGNGDKVGYRSEIYGAQTRSRMNDIRPAYRLSYYKISLSEGGGTGGTREQVRERKYF